MKNKEIKAIILAAGEGTRLRPYTENKPKCLVEVNGVSLLDRQLAVLNSAGIDEITLIGGYKSSMLNRKGIGLRLNADYAKTNMVWTLFSAESDLEGDILICYGDIVYSRDILLQLLKSDSDIAVTIDLEWESYWRARNENPLDDAETLKLDSKGQITEIGLKPNSVSEIQGQYMGLIKLSPEGVKIFKEAFDHGKTNGLVGKNVENAYMTDLLMSIIDAGYRVQSIPIQSPWVEVDTVSDLTSNITRERLIKIEADL